MKRRFSLIFLALFAILPAVVHAEWVTKEIKWRISGLGPTGTSTTIFVRDTTFNAVGGGASDVGDTTSSFSLDDATVPPRGTAVTPLGGSAIGASGTAMNAPNDTTVVAWLLLQCDSSTVTTATATSVTALFDGRVGGMTYNATLGEGWKKADSTFINGAAGGTMVTGDDFYRIPIHTVSPYGAVLAFPEMRARIGTATGSIPAARVYVRYYRPDVREYNN